MKALKPGSRIWKDGPVESILILFSYCGIQHFMIYLFSWVCPWVLSFLSFNVLIFLFYPSIHLLSLFLQTTKLQHLLLTVSTCFCHLLAVFHHHWKRKGNTLKTMSTYAQQDMGILPNWQTAPSVGNYIRCGSKQRLLFFQTLALKFYFHSPPFFNLFSGPKPPFEVLKSSIPGNLTSFYLCCALQGPRLSTTCNILSFKFIQLPCKQGNNLLNGPLE